MNDTAEAPAAPPVTKRKGVRFRPAMRQTAREPAREDARAPLATQKRLYRSGQNSDPLYINPDWVPDDMSWEWKRATVYGMPDDNHMIGLRNNHWTPVDASRFPHMVIGDKTGPIIRTGMMLMERPKYLTDEAKQEDKEKAEAATRNLAGNLTAAPSGQFTRQHGSAGAQIKTHREAYSVPAGRMVERE